MRHLRKIYALAALSLTVSASTWAASNVSPKFDGTYTAIVETVPWMSTGPACTPFPLGDIAIAKGILTTASVRGFITEEGYLEASIALPGGGTTPLNGRLDNGEISAGAIDPKSGCAWLVKLKSSGAP